MVDTAVISDALSAGLEVLTPLLDSSDASESTIAAKCIGLLHGYHARWQNGPYTILEVEHTLSSDLYNPATQAKSRTFRVAGKLDVIARDAAGHIVLFDHKTTSTDITDPNGPYWRQLAIEGQVTHYMLLQWLNGEKVDSALWDVMRKPGISPKLLSKKDREAAYHSKRYFDTALNADELDRLTATERETPIMYAARLADDCTNVRPEWYFQRRSVPRLDSEIFEYAKELWQHSQDIILTRRNQFQVRNSGACMLYGSPCKFLGICSGHDSPDSERWTKQEWVHPELPVLGGDVLTNSRIRAFQTCRRKHFYQYDLGIQRIDEEERESLVFGTLWHSCQEAYFKTLQQQQKEQ